MENIPRMELIQVAENVAREKLIEKEDVILAMEDAIQKAARSKYGLERDIRANINRNNGAISIEQFTQVVDDVVDEATQMSLSEAQRRDTSLKVGDFYKKVLPPFDFGRIAAQSAKQVISQKVRDAERLRQFNQFKDRVGEIILGTVKRFDNFSVTLDIGKAEGVIRKDEMIPREQLKPGDRVRTYILNVSEEIRGPQIFLSRSSNEFLRLLFTQEVPEIYDGIIEVKNVAREPGSRAKISVFSKDNTIDPVGACVGMRGSRVQAVVNELQGEKIEIIPWSEDPVTFVINSLAPAVPSKVIMDEEAGRMEVIVPDDQLSLAIGRRGQNVRLASNLSNWYIDVVSETEESEKRQDEINERTKIFIDSLDVDDVIAHLIVAEGYSTIDEIANSSIEELNNIEGFEEELSLEIKERAVNYVKQETELVEKKLKDSDIDNRLYEFTHLSKFHILTLVENGIKTLDDLADLDSEELFTLLGKSVFDNENEAGEVIMEARKHWFEEDKK
ncbi:MAG: transcription termination/antitermination protein NusA [SAR116 cluster bacterium]|nr:transcription termination/antitermination protein NusA [SAR116 cluster bacterium]RPH11454.1 MAG: transcription termination/antitermination protein NusA [Alphaproteobacteria bacterium TMED54]